MRSAIPRLGFFLLSLACTCVPSAAQVGETDPGLRTDAGGIITSQAVTVAGHEFSDYFIAAWRDKPDSERYAIAIRERPSARLGSQVRIDFAQRPVYQSRLPPSRAALKALGEQAADIAYQAVQATEAQRVLIIDADLAADEF
jgi:curli production assembly/transport component CsgE